MQGNKELMHLKLPRKEFDIYFAVLSILEMAQNQRNYVPLTTAPQNIILIIAKQ